MSSPPVTSSSMTMNTSFTKEVVDSLVTSFTGDYINFQAVLENFFGPHTPVHVITGGDMASSCPFGLGEPQCYGGPKWAPNGEHDSYQPCTLADRRLLLAQILFSSFTMLFVLQAVLTGEKLTCSLYRVLTRFGTIGNIRTRQTRTCLRGVPSRPTPPRHSPSIPLGPPLGSMYVATHCQCVITNRVLTFDRRAPCYYTMVSRRTLWLVMSWTRLVEGFVTHMLDWRPRLERCFLRCRTLSDSFFLTD